MKRGDDARYNLLLIFDFLYYFDSDYSRLSNFEISTIRLYKILF